MGCVLFLRHRLPAGSPVSSHPRIHTVYLIPTFLVLMGLGSATHARPPGGTPNSPQAYVLEYYHDVGPLVLKVTNLGMFGGDLTQGLNANWRGNEYLYYSGLWVGAIGSDSQPHVSTPAPAELRPELDPRWVVYESFEGMRGGIRLGPGGASLADDDQDGLVDEDFHNGLDDDGDGRIDEDFAGIGQQMLSCMYKDNTPESMQIGDHVPLNILVRQSSYQWSVPGINQFVGVNFEIVNIGEQRLRSLYLGLFTDSDVGPPAVQGYWDDDLVGWDMIDTTVVDPEGAGPCADVDLRIQTVFMWDAPDNGTTITGGDAPGVFGTLFLGHATDDTGIRAPQQVGLRTVLWFHEPDAPQPTTDGERYQAMFQGTKPLDNANQPDDYSHLISAGQFSQLDPGESLDLQVGYVIGEGQSGFRSNAVMAQRVFNGRYVDADQNTETGVGGRERCLQILEPGQIIVWDDPCDTLNTTIEFRHTDPCNVPGLHYVDADCDPCTGVNGQETNISWVGPVAPPSPRMNTDPTLDPLTDPSLIAYKPPAGDRRVTLQWDNASELHKNPITGEQIFEGYRIYKVNSWTGGPIGPTPENFILIGIYRLNPEQGGRPLEEVLNRSVEAVGQTEDGKPIYPIGRYEFVDDYVLNNHIYFYSVAAFGLTTRIDPNTGEEVIVEIAGLPSATVSEAVVPCDTCNVVPVKLRSFTAERVGEGARLRWVVTDATDHAGFHVHRTEPGQERIRITEGLLAGGSEYEYLDTEAPPGGAEYWLEELSRTGARQWYGPARLAPSPKLPPKFVVGMATPNPFRGGMRLAYALPDSRPVRVSVYDLLGRRVRVLADETQGPGEFSLEWRGNTDSGAGVAPGLYLIRFQAGGEVLTRKVLFVR